MAESATLKDVADRAGVSIITASRALNGGAAGLRVSAGTRRRIESAASALGYRPHAAGRTLRAQRTGLVGALLINNPERPLTNLAAFEYILGLNAGLAEAGLLLTLVRLTDLDGADPSRIRVLRERALDGFIAISHLPDQVSGFLERHSEHVIWLDTGHDAPANCLRRDEAAAGRNAAGLLLAAGRRRVLWLQRPPEYRDHYSLADRESGARAACAAAGADFVEFAGAPGSGIDASALARALAAPGTGLLLADPVQARWLAPFLAERGLVPGRDVGVACCDGDQHIALAWPGLSRVQTDRYALGMDAAHMLAALIDGTPTPSCRVPGTVVPGTTA